MSRRGRFYLLASLLAADLLALVIALVGAYWLSVGAVTALPPTYLVAGGVGLLPWLAVFATLRLYDLETVLEDSQEYATVATGCTYGILLLIVLATVLRQGSLALTWLFISWMAAIVAVSAGRFAMRRVVSHATRRALDEPRDHCGGR